MSNAERIERALKVAGMGGIFLVKTHPKYNNLVTLTHNKERASRNHEGEDLYKAGAVLKTAGFSGCIAGLTLTVRESTASDKLSDDDYERHEGQYAGAYDIELADLC